MSDLLVALLNLRQRVAAGGGGGGGGGVTAAQFTLLRNVVAQLDQAVPRVKVHPVQTATAGQMLFTLPEPYVMGQGRLLVYSGGVLVDTYSEVSETEIEFTSGREAGEKIRILEIQLGSDTGATVVDALPADLGGSEPTPEQLSLLQNAIAQLDRSVPRVKVHPVQTAVAGQVLFTLPEPYVMGQNRLLVYSGGVLVDSYTEISETEIQFTSGRAAGEKIRILEIQIGSDTGATVVDTLPTNGLAGEVPSGSVTSTDGVDGNGTFTVAAPVDATVTPRVFISGGLELSPSMFSRTDQTFTIFAPYKPIVGETVSIFYKRSP